MTNRLNEIRNAEKESHFEVYSRNELFSEGSWLAKPVKTVMEILPLFEGHEGDFRGLDLGCGVGRNCIPVAEWCSDRNCRIDCVDILEIAIEKLRQNAEKHGVSEKINEIVSDIDGYVIEKDSYDFIMAVSALEHVDSKETFTVKLQQIRDGVRKGGIVCLIMNTDVCEKDKTSGQELSAQFEVNLKTDELKRVMANVFTDWQIIKETVVHQVYDIPRGNRTVKLDTDVVTYVIKK